MHNNDTLAPRFLDSLWTPVHASIHPYTGPYGYSIKPSQKKRLPYATRQQRNNNASTKYNKEKFAWFEFLTVVLQEIQFIWDVMPHRFVNSYCSEESQCLYVQCQSLMTVIFTIKKWKCQIAQHYVNKEDGWSSCHSFLRSTQLSWQKERVIFIQKEPTAFSHINSITYLAPLCGIHCSLFFFPGTNYLGITTC